MNFPQSGPLSSDTVTRNKIVFTIVLIVCISSGIISFVMFHVQQNCTNKKQHMFSDEQVKLPDKVRWNLWSIAKETSTRSIEREKTKQHKKRNQRKVKKISLALKDLILTGFEYGNILRESFVWNMLGHPIWATVNILVTFLPGIEWYSFKRHQVPGKLSNFHTKNNVTNLHSFSNSFILGKVRLCPKSGYHLSWFISSLFFPVYVLASRVISHESC